MKEGCGVCHFVCWSVETWAFLILRLFLGLRLLTAGLGKFLGPERVFSFANVHTKFVSNVLPIFKSQTWLPEFLVEPYLNVLPYCEVAFGAMLLLGICTKPTLALMGFLYVSLAFGQMLLPAGGSTVVDIGIHIILVIAALMLAKHNKFEICKCS